MTRCSTPTASSRRRTSIIYPGGTLGGPVLIPGTQFNKNRNKLFFFTGFEYFYQVLDTGLLRATVPTAGELTGNFSPAEVAKEGNITASGGPPGQIKNVGILPGRNHSGEPDRQEHAEPDEAVSAAECRPQCDRRIQLRAGGDLQPEQHSVDVARGLQHQRQHQAVRALQPAARNPVVPGRPVVAPDRSGALPDSGGRARTSPTPSRHR